MRDRRYNFADTATLLGLRPRNLRTLLRAGHADNALTNAISRLTFPSDWVREAMSVLGRTPGPNLDVQLQALKAVPVSRRPVVPVPTVPVEVLPLPPHAP